MPIEYRDASYFNHPYGRGRVRRVEAEWGAIRATGANRTEAKAALLAAVEKQLTHAYTRRYLRTDDVTFALFYSGGWGYDIVTGDGHRSCSTLLGDAGEQEAMASMRRHFEQYLTGKEFERGVDRTNGELAGAIRAWNAERSDANYKRLTAAECSHVKHFYAAQAAELQLRTG